MSTSTPSPSELHQKIHQDPSFGWDPWLNTNSDPVKVEQAHLAAVALLYQGADTIAGDIGLLPGGLSMYASYIDNFGGYGELVAAKESTGAFLLSVTIFGGKAHCADVQPGAMRAPDLPNWIDHVALLDEGFDVAVPWVYTSASQMALANTYIGGRHVIRWSAHYGFGMHICGPKTCGWPQADWTQWADTGPQGQNFDRSVGTLRPKPVAPKPVHARGVANFSGHVNFDSGEWEIHGEPGEDIKWGTENVRWSAEIQVNGSDGSWEARGLTFNAAIPTAGSEKSINPARGVAAFTGSIDFDTGAWTIRGTPGAPQWGAKEKWSAVIKIDNRLGDWHIIGCPFNAPPMGA